MAEEVVAQPEFNHTALAEVAYNAYAGMMDFKDSAGVQLIQYPDSSLENRRAWEAAVKAVMEAHHAANAPVEHVSRFAMGSTEKPHENVEAYHAHSTYSRDASHVDNPEESV